MIEGPIILLYSYCPQPEVTRRRGECAGAGVQRAAVQSADPDGAQPPIFFVGELGPFLAVNRRFPNIGPRISIPNHKGELLGRLGAPHAGTEDGTFIAPHTLAMDSRGDLYVGEVSYSAWDHVFPGAAWPRRIRSLQKLARVI